jgi:predicted nucleic acid-binding protein
VWDELTATGRPWPGRDEVAAADWIERHTVRNQALIRALERDLDRGEAHSIALALELNADIVLVDEKEGRRAARRQGLQVVGVVGILLEAKAQKRIEELRPLLDSLRHGAGFFLSESVYAHALKLAGEKA